MVLDILKIIAGPAFDYFKNRREDKALERQEKQELKKAKLMHNLKRIENGDMHSIELDKIERNNAGWMDDFSFFVFMIPAILAFFPDAVPHVIAGFEALEMMPVWYQYALGGMLVAVWGYRRLLTPILEKWVKNKL